MLIKIIERVSFWVFIIAVWLIFALMILGLTGIVTRFFGAGMSGVLNLSVFVLIGCAYLSFAYAQSSKKHVAVEFFVQRLGIRSRSMVTIVAAFISMAACFILVLTSWPYAYRSLRIGESMDGAPFYPIWPSKLVVAVGASVLLFQTIADFVKAVRLFWVKVEGDSKVSEVGE